MIRLAVRAPPVSGMVALSVGPAHAGGAVQMELPGTFAFDAVCMDESVTLH